MKWISISAVCALAFLGGACQRQPLPGQEPMHAHGVEHHEEAAPHAAAAPAGGKAGEAHAVEAPAADAAAKDYAPQEAPKFFPDEK